MRLRSIWHLSRLAFFALDYVLCWASVVCAFKFSPRFADDIIQGGLLNPHLRFVGYGMPLAMAFGLQLAGVQVSQAGFRGSETLTRTLVGIVGGIAVFVVLHALVEFELVGRYVLIFSVLYGAALVLGSRLVLWRLAEHDTRNVLVYGPSKVAAELAAQIRALRLPIRVVGHVTISEIMPESAGAFAAARQLELHAHAIKRGAEEIIVSVRDGMSSAERQALLQCTSLGLKVVDLGYFYEIEFEKVQVEELREDWFWAYDAAHSRPVFFAFKRILDVLCSLVGLVLFAPFFPILVAAIWLQDRGPVLYSQVRLGLNNQPFRILKFRSMRLDAEKNGARWASVGDDRVTRLGRLMRKTRIDEVPQFWNILRGEMSFIGPRPERPEFVEKIEEQVPYYRYRHLIKPGLTGWAQINFPYGASVDDARQKLAYDLYYLKHASITRELHILLRTIVAMIRGAR
ncbi:exopolysaccharide biosynthesis polyprenyl glycosylphosphotransferase [Oleiharenicola sp. Vm1]|uniref:exopolysaccharide biosynthesis polyprenyl glycosylphosphotransferase n=1 Tax=Oleiharenicola sp. Vm1 TaxID=3398393 RepID=UPI0039F604FD